jgi:U3 small nucleolar RNA-associated protein 21
MAHPVTYVNKLVFAGGENNNVMQLWNVIENEKIYEFDLKSQVEAIEQSPVLDVMAVGCTNGAIHLLNLKFD